MTIDRSPYGEVVPIPSDPAEVKVLVPVAPKAAFDEVCVRVKSEVPVALVKVIPPLKMLVPVKVLLV